ncbi:hypothetical protein ACGGZK_06565 [Agromyces sp. MMS24-K17]|uniref:hypothetical protein n=1 Tax=Agromyces sp. MMS24-K17 TaxID=3372850 RepID=UPI003753F289
MGVGKVRAHGTRRIAIGATAAVAVTLGIAAPAAAEVASVRPVGTCGEFAEALETSGTVVLTRTIGATFAECPPAELGAGADVVIDLVRYGLYLGGDDAPGAGLFVPSDARLTIRGEEQGAYLYAGGSDGAGIGARPGSGPSGDIRIEGGYVQGFSVHAAGVGGADGDATVVVTGGRVFGGAYSESSPVNAAGIGGGVRGVGRVTVLGGIAEGRSVVGAGIGGGAEGDGVVTIDLPADEGQWVSAESRSGSGIGTGNRGGSAVVDIRGGRVIASAWGASGTGLGDVAKRGSVTISGVPSVDVDSIRSGRIEILGGSVYGSDRAAAIDPRPVAGPTPLSQAYVAVVKGGRPVVPGPRLVVVDAAGAPTGYEALATARGSAYLWLPPGPAFIRAEVDGVRRTFPVTVAADGSTRATLDFSGPTLQDRIVARFAELARRLGDSDAAVARIAKELRIPESTVRYWLRQAGELG